MFGSVTQVRILITAALLGTIGGGIAVAQTGMPARSSASADNGLSRAEFIQRAETRFAHLDVDKDGSLTRDELRVGHRRGHGRFRRPAALGQDGAPMGRPGPGAPRDGGAPVDADGDGRISRAEFIARSAERFARIDPNGDGIVDQSEMAAMPGGGRMAGRMDADNNGTLTRAEFDAMAARRFDRMDANRDGMLDAAERQAGRGGWRRGPVPATDAPPPPPPAPNGA